MSEEKLKSIQSIIEALSYPVSIIDPGFNIISSNSVMRKMYGKNTGPREKKCYEFFHNANAPVENCPMLRSLETNSREESEIYEPSIDKFLKISASPVLENGKIQYVLHSIIDVTAEKKAMQNNKEIIEIYSDTINELKLQAISAQRGRDAFLNMLEDLNESYSDLEELFLKVILVMVNTLDAKSPWTKGHSERVAMYAEKIAKEMLIDADEIKEIRLAGLLHDIGKIGTYDYLLDKPGTLSSDEFEIVKKHPAMGADILKDIKQLKNIIPFIRYHHEKLDGKGYPEKLNGKEIPLGAKILHVADSFDSMTSDRPYRPAPGMDYALSELHKYKGSQFDHEVVEAFLRILKRENSSKVSSE